MSITLGLTCNFFNEINALPGWIETHLSGGLFDEVRAYHAGPQGAYSTDGSIELLEKWGIPIDFGAIDEGFGVVRTRAIRACKSEWVMLLDCDERFYSIHRYLTCLGEGTPQSEVDWVLQQYDFRGVNLPNWENIARLGAGLQVEAGSPVEQGKHLREVLEANRPDAVATMRRHWHDLSFRRPTQNWHTDPDWQLRLVRNDPGIYFDPSVRMHERLLGANKVLHADVQRGPYFDHFHFVFKAQETLQRGHDVMIYDAIHEGRKPPTWEEYKQMRGL